MHDLYMTLHRTPELSMQEHQTAALIIERMEALGYETFVCGGTGVVAFLRNGDGPAVAFRADIDALPVQEETGLPYASTARSTLPDGTDVPVMHACGHDTHITCAIGAATLLSGQRDTWAGTLIFLFQPGEETSQGAQAMVNDRLWERAPRPEVVYAQHVWPAPAGTIEIVRGVTMAMADSWKVTVHGRGGHGSRPHQTIDPVVLAAHMIVRMQTITSREVDPQSAAVITIGTFHAGIKENIIPSSAEFTINVRSLDPDVRSKVLNALRRVIRAEAEASGAPNPEIVELYTFPLLVNDPKTTDEVKAVLSSALGSKNVRDAPAQMGSEDFGHLPQAAGVPSVYWFFGGARDAGQDDDGPVVTNHSPHFAPDMEPTLASGIKAAHAVLMSRLGTPSSGQAEGAIPNA
jgi:amidohydrolase